jgi:ParB family transcriptional regulator, chromosome partitioning protein
MTSIFRARISKIATAIENLGVAHRSAKRTLDKVFNPKHRLGIREAYEATVQFEYAERQVSRYANSLLEFIDDVAENERQAELDEEFIAQLNALYGRLKKFLGK